jgi:hypothetical protein
MYTRFVGKTNSQQPGPNLLGHASLCIVSEFTNIVQDGHPKNEKSLQRRLFPFVIA